MKKVLLFFGVLLLLLILIVFVVLAEGPMQLFSSLKLLPEKEMHPSTVAELLPSLVYRRFSPYYLQAFIDDTGAVSYRICSFFDYLPEERYMVQELLISNGTVKTKLMIGEARSFRELYPNHILGEDPDFDRVFEKLPEYLEELEEGKMLIYNLQQYQLYPR